MARPLLVVCSEMLDASHHTLALHTNNIISGNLTCQIWVLTEILEITSAKRTAVDICTRSKKDVYATGTRILTEGNTHLFYQRPVPSSCSSDTTRIQSTLCVITYTLRAICHPYCRQAKPLNGTYIPVLITSDIIDLFFQSHLCHDFSSTSLIFFCKLRLGNTHKAHH